MPIQVQAYTAGGIATGVVARAGHLRELLETGAELVVERTRWLAHDGSAERPAGELRLLPDDLCIVVGEELGGVPVHAQWHALTLDLGPYRVTGEMPTMPGFDPGRALARPTGEFVTLRDVTIALLEREEAGWVACPEALVNRYMVDRVAADLMLGFFFPGAAMAVTEGGPLVAGAASRMPAQPAQPA